MLRLKHLTLINYRNHASTELEFTSPVNVLVGGNGEGKTNILEAIYYLATGRSHRNSRDADILNWNADYFSVRGEIERRPGMAHFDVYYTRKGQKRIRINRKEIKKLSELVGQFGVVMFSPENLQIVQGSPQERRKYLDFAASQSNGQYFFYLQQYHQVLTQRNQLLKAIQEGKDKGESLPVWNQQLIDAGVEVIIRRRQYAEKLKTIIAPIHERLSDGSESLEVKYVGTLSSSEHDSPDTIRGIFNEKICRLEKAERIRGYTLVGPHRDDLLISANQIDLRFYGSQGQQRTAALSLKLAEVEIVKDGMGECPVLLLDDVMSELDDFRRKQLLSIMDGTFQTFISSTNLNPFQGKISQEYSVHRVKQGTVTRWTS